MPSCSARIPQMGSSGRPSKGRRTKSRFHFWRNTVNKECCLKDSPWQGRGGLLPFPPFLMTPHALTSPPAGGGPAHPRSSQQQTVLPRPRSVSPRGTDWQVQTLTARLGEQKSRLGNQHDLLPSVWAGTVVVKLRGTCEALGDVCLRERANIARCRRKRRRTGHLGGSMVLATEQEPKAGLGHRRAAAITKSQGALLVAETRYFLPATCFVVVKSR